MKAKLIISGSMHKPSVSGNPNSDLITTRRSPFYYFLPQFFPCCQIKRGTEATGLEWGIWLNPSSNCWHHHGRICRFVNTTPAWRAGSRETLSNCKFQQLAPVHKHTFFPRVEEERPETTNRQAWRAGGGREEREGGEGMSHLANREGLGWANSHLWD